jgi:hypothetical protein
MGDCRTITVSDCRYHCGNVEVTKMARKKSSQPDEISDEEKAIMEQELAERADPRQLGLPVVEPTPAEPTPAEPTPAEPTPVEPTPAEPTTWEIVPESAPETVQDAPGEAEAPAVDAGVANPFDPVPDEPPRKRRGRPPGLKNRVKTSDVSPPVPPKPAITPEQAEAIIAAFGDMVPKMAGNLTVGVVNWMRVRRGNKPLMVPRQIEVRDQTGKLLISIMAKHLPSLAPHVDWVMLLLVIAQASFEPDGCGAPVIIVPPAPVIEVTPASTEPRGQEPAGETF